MSLIFIANINTIFQKHYLSVIFFKSKSGTWNSSQMRL